MAYFSFFWKKHYDDIGNCCMTKPLDETTVPGTNGSRLVSYIDVSWMSDIKLKWIGWDKGGDFAWITPDGMIYRFTDLKRNERGMKYEKEVQKLELWSGGWGTDGPPENLYEWELSVQENCGFCKSTPGGKKGEKEEKEDETGDKESDKDSGVNVRDWKEFADSKPEDENNDITRTSETTNTEHVTNTGKTAYDDALENAKGGGGGKKGADDNDDEDGFIAKLPYKDLIKLPAKPEDDDEPIYRKIPQFTKPKYQNPVLDNKKVLDNQKVTENKKVTDTSKTLKLPFKVPKKVATIDKLRHHTFPSNGEIPPDIDVSEIPESTLTVLAKLFPELKPVEYAYKGVSIGSKLLKFSDSKSHYEFAIRRGYSPDATEELRRRANNAYLDIQGILSEIFIDLVGIAVGIEAGIIAVLLKFMTWYYHEDSEQELLQKIRLIHLKIMKKNISQDEREELIKEIMRLLEKLNKLKSTSIKKGHKHEWWR